MRESDQRGDAAVDVVAADLDLTSARVRVVLSYYGTYADEVDAEIEENERVADEALRAWQSQQRLLA